MNAGYISPKIYLVQRRSGLKRATVQTLMYNKYSGAKVTQHEPKLNITKPLTLKH